MKLGLRRSVAALLAGLALAACGGTGSEPPPATLPPFSPPAAPTDALNAPSPVPRTARPTVLPTGDWPAGWNKSFCAAFAEIVVAQELAVDIGRALDDGDREDALALARELEATSTAATRLLAEMPKWEPADETITELSGLLDLGGRVARSYERFLQEGRERALERAQRLGGEMRPVVDRVLADLAELRREGLTCADHDFILESP